MVHMVQEERARRQGRAAHGSFTPQRSTNSTPRRDNNEAAVKEAPSKAPGNAVAMQLAKTKMCSFFERGRCSLENCRYAHAVEELRVAPNLQKTKLCRAFMQGYCSAGENCGFAHGEEDLRVTEGVYKTQICNFFERGHCKKGARCNHAHGVADLRPTEKAPPGLGACADALPPATKLVQELKGPREPRQPLATPPGLPAQRGEARAERAFSPLTLAELLASSEASTPSVAELASLAFSPVPSTAWGPFSTAPCSPQTTELGELTPPRHLDPLKVLLEHSGKAASLVPTWKPGMSLCEPALTERLLPDPVVIDLSKRLASLDMAVQQLTADVKGIRDASIRSF